MFVVSKKQVAIVSMAASMMVLAGCATTDQVTAREASVKAREAKLAATEATLMREKDSLAKREMEMKSASMGSHDSSLFPPKSEPGHCYARVMKPAKYVTKTEKVLKKAAGTRIETMPATFRDVDEKILLKEASAKIVVIPATYKTVEERLLVKPASTKLIEVAATYKTVEEKVLEKAAHTIWKRGSDSINGAVETKIDEDSGEIMCLVEVPAKYRTITKRVIGTPAHTKKMDIKAEYKTVSRRVVATPASTKKVDIPAEYGKVATKALVKPASEKVIKIPAEYQTVTKREKVTDEKIVWREVLCEVNLTASRIRGIQTSLTEKGLYSGAVDGKLSQSTFSAVQKFASANGLPSGNNYISIETVRALGN